ncbi:MAG: diguanylate cyclase [Lachnospira eligens]
MEYTKSVIASKDDKIHYMIMFDVDNFKSINDTYGHLFGDEVLSKIAGIINANLNGRGIALEDLVEMNSIYSLIILKTKRL